MRLVMLVTMLVWPMVVLNAQVIKTYSSRDFSFMVYNSGEELFGRKGSVAVHDHERSVDSIVINRKLNGKRIQTIVPGENSYSYSSAAGNDPLTIEDMNFDGVADISIRQFLPAAPNIPYYCWVYNVSKGIFVEDTELEEITSAVFDQKNKTVTSEWRGNAGSYGASTYRYIGSRLTLVKEVTKTAAEDNGDMITVTKERVNGKMKVISKTRSAKWD